MTSPITRASASDELVYRIPEGVSLIEQHSRMQVATASGGRIWADRSVVNLWKAADQRSLAGILADKQFGFWNESYIRLGLACLAEAGLLARSNCPAEERARKTVVGELVSAILVTYNSRDWLQGCLSSIAAQTYSPIEIIIVDNASQDGSAEWIQANASHVKLISNTQPCPLAEMLNTGILHASGRYVLLLNPDVLLDPEAVGEMVQTAQLDATCAAVAAKLKFLWAPSFLNGLGNIVGAFSWGTDIGLGHLDLGQFDTWNEIPSACFAAVLIPKEKFNSIGLLDVGFPLYYEDSEWCYRARLMGFSIRAAPQARCLHAFGSRIPAGENSQLSSSKLQRVTFGRLRFIIRINGGFAYWRFLFAYLMEDISRCLYYLIIGRSGLSRALLQAWAEYLVKIPEALSSRKIIQAQRKINDRELFKLQKKFPAPLIRAGLPVLTWDVICNEYAPLLKKGEIQNLPEFAHFGSMVAADVLDSVPLWKRALEIGKNEGTRQMVYWLARWIQWQLVRSV